MSEYDLQQTTIRSKRSKDSGFRLGPLYQEEIFYDLHYRNPFHRQQRGQELYVDSPASRSEKEAEKFSSTFIHRSDNAQNESVTATTGPSIIETIQASGNEGGFALNEAQEKHVYSAVNSVGTPLPETQWGSLEQSLGQDLSEVRIHTGDSAEKAAASINAKAFTVGKDIVFGKGEYQPGTRDGDHLLAHEMAHVAQNGGDASAVRRAPKSDDNADPNEKTDQGVRESKKSLPAENSGINKQIQTILNNDLAVIYKEVANQYGESTASQVGHEILQNVAREGAGGNPLGAGLTVAAGSEGQGMVLMQSGDGGKTRIGAVSYRYRITESESGTEGNGFSLNIQVDAESGTTPGKLYVVLHADNVREGISPQSGGYPSNAGFWLEKIVIDQEAGTCTFEGSPPFALHGPFGNMDPKMQQKFVHHALTGEPPKEAKREDPGKPHPGFDFWGSAYDSDYYGSEGMAGLRQDVKVDAIGKKYGREGFHELTPFLSVKAGSGYITIPISKSFLWSLLEANGGPKK